MSDDKKKEGSSGGEKRKIGDSVRKQSNSANESNSSDTWKKIDKKGQGSGDRPKRDK